MFSREREQLRRLVLVPYRPFRNLSLGIGGVILIIAAGFGGFYAGSHYGNSYASGDVQQEIKTMREIIYRYEQQSHLVKTEVAAAHHDREIVSGATEKMLQDNKDLLEQITTLEDQVMLYKKLLSPRASSSAGLAADKLDLQKSAQAGRVMYRLLLTQANAKAANTAGVVQAKIIGGGRSVVVPVGDNNFSFQYFQSIKGEWIVPNNFRPESVEIILKPAKGAAVQKNFRWDIQP